MDRGSELQLTGTFPVDLEDPLNPLACSKKFDFDEKIVTFGPGRRSRVMFFELFSDCLVQIAYF